MSDEYVIQKTTLDAIADAIRRKEGSEAPIPVKDYAPRILHLAVGDMPSAGFFLSGNMRERFQWNRWNWYVDDMGEFIVATDCYNFIDAFTISDELQEMNIDFNVVPNFKLGENDERVYEDYINFSSCFSDCKALKKINGSFKGIEAVKYINTDHMFYSCYNLKDISYDFFNNIVLGEYEGSHKGNIEDDIGYGAKLFSYCFSLRELPDMKKLVFDNYNWTFMGCSNLNEIKNVPVLLRKISSQDSKAFNSAFSSCSRVKNITFRVNDDGTPIVVEWKDATLDLSIYVGWKQIYTDEKADPNKINFYNSGITLDTRIVDADTYRQFKDHEDAWTSMVEYSRYNKLSAMYTIHSLPDASAYLASLGGGINTIKFKGAAGSLTDQGAIENLDTDDIALAASKGWTVAFV